MPDVPAEVESKHPVRGVGRVVLAFCEELTTPLDEGEFHPPVLRSKKPSSTTPATAKSCAGSALEQKSIPPGNPWMRLPSGLG